VVCRDHGLRQANIHNSSARHPNLHKGLAAGGLPTLAVLRGLKKL
jgi:hypothetical protein